MTAFWIALVAGLLVGAVYVALAVRTFARVRRAVLAAEDVERPGDALVADGGGVTWKALGAGAMALLVIVLVSVDGAFWYLPPALAIGSSIAVVAAFLLDRR